jgi:hypothetical protein
MAEDWRGDLSEHRVAGIRLTRADGNGPPEPFDPSAIYGINFKGPIDLAFQVLFDALAVAPGPLEM